MLDFDPALKIIASFLRNFKWERSPDLWSALTMSMHATTALCTPKPTNPTPQLPNSSNSLNSLNSLNS